MLNKPWTQAKNPDSSIAARRCSHNATPRLFAISKQLGQHFAATQTFQIFAPYLKVSNPLLITISSVANLEMTTQAIHTVLAPVTRIARRCPQPGKEVEYEALVREMFSMMRQAKGFLGAELIPPETAGEDYQVIVNFASEADLLNWDASSKRKQIQSRMRQVATSEPEYRRLSGLEGWFASAIVPASMHPPRTRMATITWLGIFPTVSIYLFVLGPWLQQLPFLGRTAILTILIVITMTWLVMPNLTKWFRPWLNKP